MEAITITPFSKRENLYRWAYALALITIFYNLVEGVISVFFGLEDETIALFGFGLDSIVEVISGVGIWHMLRRLKQGKESPESQRLSGGAEGNVSPDSFESQALRVTGSAFYILTVGLIITAGINLYQGRAPVTTIWGIVVSSISIMTMWLLIHYKVKVGRILNSQAILSDANCTRACMYLSIVLLVASAGYELTGIGGLDSAGAILIAYISFKEGQEAFEKAASGSLA